MNMLQSAAVSAAFAVAAALGSSVAASAAPVDEATCSNAKLTGSLAEIQTNCPRSEWPKMGVFVAPTALIAPRAGVEQALTLDQMNCITAQSSNDPATREAFCGKS